MSVVIAKWFWHCVISVHWKAARDIEQNDQSEGSEFLLLVLGEIKTWTTECNMSAGSVVFTVLAQ